MRRLLSRSVEVGALLLLALGPSAPAWSAPSVVISPASGTYLTTQAFDLTVIVTGTTSAVTGGTATFDGIDVSVPLRACVVPGTLTGGGRTFRCPSLSGDILGVGLHTLTVVIGFEDGASASGQVTWQVLSATP